MKTGPHREDEWGLTLKRPTVRVIVPGRRHKLEGTAEVVLEDGTRLTASHRLPPDLPLGYHQIRWRGVEAPTLLMVAPRQCYLPPGLEGWGVALQLYALRSRRSWGMGDLADLREFARSPARKLGAGLIQVNPLCASTPTCPQQDSPYCPGSRRYWNPLYLRIEEVTGASKLGGKLRRLSRAGWALNQAALIDRDAIFSLKMEALRIIWAGFTTDAAFERFLVQEGESLREFATFCALAQHFRKGWRRWPAPYQRADMPAVRRFQEDRAQEVRFHQWLQWLLEQQLARAAAVMPLMQDLPIGVDPDGADAWVWQDLLVLDVSIGAPPDRYNSQGQDWGLPPFVPEQLRVAAYEPLRQTVRALMRHAQGLRIDHVMGLFRLFWIPKGSDPSQGHYVRYPTDELLAVLAIESHRARAWIVGEDLGTVERGVRPKLRRWNIMTHHLLWFDRRSPKHYRRNALAAVTTHDLFTVAGLWTSSDFEAQQRCLLKPDRAAFQRIRRRVRAWTGLAEDALSSDAILQTYRLLAGAPSRLQMLTLDDALAATARPNMPGTTRAWPNWRLPLPKSLEAIRRTPLLRRLAYVFNQARKRPA